MIWKVLEHDLGCGTRGLFAKLGDLERTVTLQMECMQPVKEICKEIDQFLVYTTVFDLQIARGMGKLAEVSIEI